MTKVFRSDLEVPDLCPPELLLPNKSEFLDMAIPREGGNVSPVELSWLLFDRQRADDSRILQLNSHLEATALLGEEVIEEVHSDILEGAFLNHNLRVVARIALDPRRRMVFDFAEVYDLDKTKRFPRSDERIYFEEFYDNYGVVERSLKQT